MRELLSFIPPMHPEGRRFVVIFAAVALVLFFIWQPLGWLGVIATVWCAWFFRDPERVTPERPGLIIAPADGVVNMITQAAPPPELGLGETPLTRISIFMNVFNVHIVRSPVEGAAVRTSHRPGKFFNASLEKASEENERYSILMRTGGSHDYAVVLVAGLVARRILPFITQGAHLEPGDRLGLIRFGSRVDVYLPAGLEPLVSVGQTSVGGETVLADHRAHDDHRPGRRS
ncbi:phosphatidylserine decarboxylase [Pyruvatibacter sp.]|uniref:phosphatidylserine decarboxylase n=1 Tax=Pyruvatibacter sp. TaxID=1981328 RepID=UPI0032EC2F47